MVGRQSGTFANSKYSIEVFINSAIPVCCLNSIDPVTSPTNKFWGFAFVCPTCNRRTVEYELKEITSYPQKIERDGDCLHDKNHMITESLCTSCDRSWTEVYYAGECKCGWPYANACAADIRQVNV